MTTRMTAGERLDAVEPGAFHRRLLTLIGAGMFLDGFDVYMAGGVLGSMVQRGESTLTLNAYFISATFAGMLVGAALSGFIGDRFGRRASYQTNLMLFGAASLAGAFAPNMHTLIGLRFLMGVGLGAEIVVGYAMLTEFMPAHVRGRWSAMLAMLANVGLLGSTVLSYIVIPTLGWRWMFGIAGVGALFVWYLRKSMPESPRWLEAVGRGDEAAAILQTIEQNSGGERPRASIDAKPIAVVSVAPQSGLTWKRLLLGIIVNVVVGTVLYGFVSWVPTFLVKAGASISSSLGYVAVMSLGGPLGAWLAYISSDRIGRKKSLLLASAATIIFGVCYTFVRHPAAIMMSGFCLFSSIYFLLSASIATYVPELFETRWRLRGVGICSTVGRLATVFSPHLVVLAFSIGGLTGVVAFLSATLIVLMLTVLLIGVETRGLPLENVEAGRILAPAGLDRNAASRP